jgi:hypothetical protein
VVKPTNAKGDGPEGLALSKSKLGVFAECERKWAYLDAFSWDVLDPRVKFLLKAQARLMPFSMLPGQVVDDTITESLRHYFDTRQWLPDPLQRAKAIVKEYLQFSKEFAERVHNREKWPTSHRQPLDRMFFGEEITPEEKRAATDCIRECVEHFFASELPDHIASFPIEQWRLPSKAQNEPRIPWFIFDDIPIYANYDFAIVGPEKTTIFEWKTGRRDTEAATEQLHWYAVYAHERWLVAYDQIRIAPIWLRSDPQALRLELLEQPVDMQRIESITRRWREMHALLTERVTQAKDHASLERVFPTTGFMQHCGRCVFRACPAYQEYLKQTGMASPTQKESGEASTEWPAESAN